MFFRHLSRLLLLTFQSERIQRATVRVEGRDDLNKSKKSEMNEMLDVLLRRHLTATRFFFYYAGPALLWLPTASGEAPSRDPSFVRRLTTTALAHLLDGCR